MPNDASLVPSVQYRYEGLPALDQGKLYVRRESVFLLLAGVFLGTLAMLNILGISRFIKLGELTVGQGPEPLTLVFAVAVGVLPYPITFLCTDYISELYGRKRASRVVWVGLILNLWVVAILWVGGILPGFESQTPFASSANARVTAEAAASGLDEATLESLRKALAEVAPVLEEEIEQHAGSFAFDPSGRAGAQLADLLRDEPEAMEFLENSPSPLSGAGSGSIQRATARAPVFFEVRTLAFGAVIASMIAYLAAQLVDVYVFHFWKWLTKGKHLWLRNNGSTLVSQLVDTTAVILITYQLTKFIGIINPEKSVPFQLAVLIVTGYAFKLLVALLDTVPFMLGAPLLARYLRLPPPSSPESHPSP